MTEFGLGYRILNPEEEKEFRQWARLNYTPGDEIKEFWHPVVRNECRIMNEGLTTEEKIFDYELTIEFFGSVRATSKEDAEEQVSAIKETLTEGFFNWELHELNIMEITEK